MNHVTLVNAVQQLSLCRDIDSIMDTLRTTARTLTGADGITVVLRDGDQCHYADENAIAPLWKGKRFPMSTCISGWAMLNKQQVAVADIYADARIPHDAYRPTFVKSLAMTPIRRAEPIGAIGAYWAEHHEASEGELQTLQALGDSASVAFENVRLIETLQRASRQKDDFLLMLAHELRNPLVPVRNAAHMLRPGAGSDERAGKAYSILDRQMSHLERMLGDLLDVARMTSGSISVKKERVDLARALRQLVDDLRASFDEAGVVLESTIPGTSLWIDADATRIVQAIGNLLDNARKYAGRGTLVSVSLDRDRATRQAVVVVRDTGVGIEPALLSTIFDVFAQADRSLARTPGGIGLGLSLARGIVTLHDGTITAASAGVGKGAEFVVRLPELVQPATAAADEPVDAQATSGKRVLIVEDNKDAAETLRMILEMSGFSVTVAHNGPDGVSAARSHRPEVVLCDIGLPGLDGYAVAERLREDPLTSQARLIAVSGYGTEDDRARSQLAGFDLHLVKPVRPDVLMGYITRAA